jgi:predicted GIY-YIG superfamily endonuclease
MHYVYILRCADGTLYTGYARDPGAREHAHNNGRGAKYTMARRPVRLVYTKRCRSLSAALKQEYQLKQRTRAEKEALIAAPPASPRKSPARR